MKMQKIIIRLLQNIIKIAAAKYRKTQDQGAVEHAKAAITASEDAAKATEKTKSILPE